MLFVDLRGFTSFTNSAAPEDVMGLLDDFHAVAGRLAQVHRGVIERFTGDGLMVFFNAPAFLPDATAAAVRMALALRSDFRDVAAAWSAKGYDLDLGIGVARGFATVGMIGSEARYDYGVIGTVTNLAARLCSAADVCRILASRSVVGALGELVDADFVGNLWLKGFLAPVDTFSIRSLRGSRDMNGYPADGRVGGAVGVINGASLPHRGDAGAIARDVPRASRDKRHDGSAGLAGSAAKQLSQLSEVGEARAQGGGSAQWRRGDDGCQKEVIR